MRSLKIKSLFIILFSSLITNAFLHFSIVIFSNTESAWAQSPTTMQAPKNLRIVSQGDPSQEEQRPQKPAIDFIMGSCVEGRYADIMGKPSRNANFSVKNWHESSTIHVEANVPTGNTWPATQSASFLLSPGKSISFPSIGFKCSSKWYVYAAVYK